MEEGNFSHDQVRDLAWAGFGPALFANGRLRGPVLPYRGYWEDHLRVLDQDPAPLADFIARSARDGRLGLYYETLWHYLLSNDPEIEFIAHNLPVRDGKRTIGEFDCLYWSQREQQHIHLELAVKFYLGVPDRGIWLGPGQKDRLDLKLARLEDHQARLSHHPCAQALLADIGIKHCESRIDLKGYLFQPEAGMPAPEDYDQRNRMFNWYPLSRFGELAARAANGLAWQEIPRRNWLSSYHCDDPARRSSAMQLECLHQRLTNHCRPVLLAACDARGVEMQRCFVTPDAWPDRIDP